MTATAPLAVSHALNRVMARDRGRILAALAARLGDLQLAEDALQEAAISAMTHLGRTGLPDQPQGWLIRVAARKALDRLRSEGRSAPWRWRSLRRSKPRNPPAFPTTGCA